MTGNQLKILALITMTIDHIGVVLLPQYIILRIIGRLTYPIFAYMIAEGCYYTRSKARYLGGIVLLGLACQIGFFVATASLEQSILSTFVLSILTIYALQCAVTRKGALGILAVVGALVLDVLVTIWLPLLLAGTDFVIDYGFFGVLLPVFCYVPRLLAEGSQGKKLQKVVDKYRLPMMLACATMGMALLCVQMLDWLHGIQWFSLCAIVPLALYNGRRGTAKLKYLFYVYYPLHLVAIWSAAMLIG